MAPLFIFRPYFYLINPLIHLRLLEKFIDWYGIAIFYLKRVLNKGCIMIYLKDYLDEDFVWFLDPAPKNAILKTMAEGLSASPNIADSSAFLQAVVEREKLMSTGLGLGMAIPHVKIDSVKEITLGVGIIRGGTEWDALDGLPVQLVFLFAAGAEQHHQYLRLLSKVILVMKNKVRREKLSAAKTVEEVLQLFAGV